MTPQFLPPHLPKCQDRCSKLGTEVSRPQAAGAQGQVEFSLSPNTPIWSGLPAQQCLMSGGNEMNGNCGSELVPTKGLYPRARGGRWAAFPAASDPASEAFGSISLPPPAFLPPALFSRPVLQTWLTGSALSSEAGWWDGQWEVRGSFN